jgi:hypothetical protein
MNKIFPAAPVASWLGGKKASHKAIIARIATFVLELFMLFVAFRLSIFLAKFALALVIAQTILSSTTTMGVSAPQPYLFALAPFALVWCVLRRCWHQTKNSQLVQTVHVIGRPLWSCLQYCDKSKIWDGR